MTTPTLKTIAERILNKEFLPNQENQKMTDPYQVGTPQTKGPKPHDVFKNADPGNLRVKAATEQYSTAKAPVMTKDGAQLKLYGTKPAESQSEAEAAMLGAFLRQQARKDGIYGVSPMDDHERNLLGELYSDRTKWCGEIGNDWQTGLPGSYVKTVLDDGTSGGQYLIPEWFDENVVTFPLLSGELTPYVTMVTVPRGSSFETASVSNPTVTWNQSEGSAIDLFDTTSLIAQINGSMFSIMVAVEVGRDMINDSMVNIGNVISANVGQRFSAELDRVIAVGDGSDEPTGLFTGSSQSVPSVEGTGGALTVTDELALMFGIDKQYRMPNKQAVRYLSNDAQYQQFRAIATGVTGDERLLNGMDVKNYRMLDWGFSIQNDIANGTVGFGDLSKFRLYRREGMSVRWYDGGKTLARSNTVLLVCRARYGGKLMDSNAFASMTDASVA